MSSVYNTSYKVHVQQETQAVVDSVNIEQGAMMVTDEALFMGGAHLYYSPKEELCDLYASDELS